MISAPAFMSLGTEAVPGAATAALTGIVLLATCGPTFLLHAFTKSYIITLKASPRDQDGACLMPLAWSAARFVLPMCMRDV
jgi:hypothetical protein